jgi:hypothetical protein
MEQTKAGFAKVEITPAVGCSLSGYAARTAVSAGVHDPLFARALILENGEQILLMVSVDLLALSSEFVTQVRERIGRKLPISRHQILIGATHTHSGPNTVRTFFNATEELDERYMDFVASSIAEAAERAWSARFAARVGFGQAHIPALGVNRRNPENGFIDRTAAIIRIDDMGRNCKAVVVVYGCHPTVLGVENLYITADFPAPAIAGIERALCQGFAMFFNGAEANISVGHSPELTALGLETPNRTFERAAELGQQLTDATLAALPSIQTKTDVILNGAVLDCELRGRRYGSIVELEAALKDVEGRIERRGPPKDALSTELQLEKLYALIRLNNARQLAKKNGRIPFDLQAFRIGGALFLGVPAEVFSETGRTIKEQLGKDTFVIGLANGYEGYLPAKSAFAEGGYEVEASYCDSNSEQHLVERALELHRRLLPAVAAR